MRVLVAWILALGLVALPAMAGTGGNDGKDGDKKNSAAVSKDASGSTSTDAKPDPAAKPVPASLENEVQQLRDLIEAQTKLLKDQSEQLKDQQQKMQLMQVELDSVATASGTAPGLVNEGGEPILASPVTASGIVRSPSQDKKDESPIAIHFKGITLTPGGFFAAETAWRSRGVVDDVNTDFKAVPLSAQSAGQLSEWNFSGRQSRISMKAEGKLADVKLTGYYEADFLGAGTTSNNNQTNSYVFRQRQFWAQAAFDNGFKFTGGQQWSLITETRHGLDNLTEAIPLTIDAQYQVGFSWARQYGLRITKNLGDKLWLGLSMEGSQTTINGGKVTQTNFTGVPALFAAPGDLSGLYNNQANYSFNATPDFVVKAAWEPGFGHYEVFGIVSTYKDRIFPCANANALNPCLGTITAASATGAFNNTTTGGGAGANGRWDILEKKVDIGLHFLWSDGEGRYGSSGLSDITFHPNGTIEPIRNYQAMGSLELHPMPKLDIYAYAGGEYDQRTAYTLTRQLTATPTFTTLGIGYGSPLARNDGCFTEPLPSALATPGGLANCQQDIRSIFEGTLGFWYRFYQGEKGRFQFGAQYSYVVRNTWSGACALDSCTRPGANPNAYDSMWFTSFRYYLP